MVTIAILLIILERIFSTTIMEFETEWLLKMQKFFELSRTDKNGVTKITPNFFFTIMAVTQEFNSSIMIFTHLILLIYFNYCDNAAISLIIT